MKHTKLYLIALAIACSMLMVCPFAFADGMDESSRQAVYEFLGSNRVNTYGNYLTSVLDECPYFYIMKNDNYSSGFAAYFTTNPIVGGCFSPTTGSSSYVCMNKTTYDPVPAGVVYVWYESGSWTTCYKYTYSATAAQNTLIGGKSATRSTHYDVRGYFDTMNVSRLNTYLSNFSGVVGTRSNGGIAFSFEQNYNPISYSDDERLKLYKLWSSQNGDSLVVDLSEFRTYTAAAAYDFSNIVLTLTCNGVDTEYTLPLTSSTINNGWDNSSNLYTISTPVSDFILSETYDTYITKVSFSLDFSSPGGSGTTPFYISTNFPLDVHHSIITPDVIPTPATIYDDPAKPIDISDRQYDLFQQLQSNVAGGDIVYINNYPVLPSWANVYNLNTFFYDNNLDDLNIYHGAQITGNYFIDSKYDFDIKSFLYDNANSAYYDVVIIRIDNTVWPSVVTNNTIPDSQQLYGYVVLYTSTYYMRLDAETQINILEAIQLDAKQSIENWNWLVEKMDDFESKSLEILNPLYDETTYIDNKLASILYAVNNIESYNDSSIVTLLTDIKGLLSNPENEIDTPQECIQLYEAHPDYFNELWGTPTPALRSASVTPSPNNPYISSDYVRADLIPAWWEGKTLTMVYILKNDGDTSRFYDSILGGLFDAYENLIESDSSFTNYIDSLFKTGYDYTDSFYGHLFDIDYNPEEWEGGFGTSE